MLHMEPRCRSVVAGCTSFDIENYIGGQRRECASDDESRGGKDRCGSCDISTGTADFRRLARCRIRSEVLLHVVVVAAAAAVAAAGV
jgi:hypothetical protein